jgi:hypothetical protein
MTGPRYFDTLAGVSVRFAQPDSGSDRWRRLDPKQAVTWPQVSTHR